MINQVRSGVANVQVKNKPSKHTDKQAQTCCPGVSYMQGYMVLSFLQLQPGRPG